MFAETKTLRVDNYSLEKQKKDILKAIIKGANEKLLIIRKYCPKSMYRCNQDLKNDKKIADSYEFEFYNYESNETLGGLRILVKIVEETQNDKQ